MNIRTSPSSEIDQNKRREVDVDALRLVPARPDKTKRELLTKSCGQLRLVERQHSQEKVSHKYILVNGIVPFPCSTTSRKLWNIRGWPINIISPVMELVCSSIRAIQIRLVNQHSLGAQSLMP